MTYYINHIKDVLGNNYLGIKIPKSTLTPFVEDMKGELSKEDFESFTGLKNQRDNGEYHITVINVIEYNKLIKDMGMDKFTESLQKVFSFEIDDLKLLGLGSATKKENKAYFVVCESDKLDSVLSRYSLREKDFHITLGFKYKDVFGVRKNKVLTKKSPFLNKIKEEYNKLKNWNFVKDIENFDLGKDEEIIIVDISESLMKIKYKGYYMDVGVVDETLRILTQYSMDIEKAKMSQTEINKYIKNNT